MFEGTRCRRSSPRFSRTVGKMSEERLQLHLQHGVRRLASWRSDHPAASSCRYVTVGQLADGRWFAELTGERGAVVCADEEQARTLAAGWLATGDWWETPAEYDARHEPTEPGWRKTGQLWVRDGG